MNEHRSKLLTALMAVAFAIGAVLAGWGLQALAQIRGVTEEEIERTTWENACRMYGIKD